MIIFRGDIVNDFFSYLSSTINTHFSCTIKKQDNNNKNRVYCTSPLFAEFPWLWISLNVLLKQCGFLSLGTGWDLQLG